MGYNLTNEFIDQTFQQLVQISGSVLLNGTGSVITDLDFTGSHVESASHAEFADEAYSASNATNALSADSASYVAGANVDGTVTSASFASTSISASFADNSTTASFALNFNPSATASYADYATSASYAITASHVVGIVDSASYALFATSASFADSALTSDSTTEIFVNAKNVQGVAIPKGYAVHSSGVTGENVNITTASFLDSSLMPAIGITQTQINAGAVGEVIITGRLKNVNTSGLVAGANVYVNGEGALTATKPTGSALIQNIGTCAKVNATEGEIIVMGAGRSNDVPNITENYLWLGNSNQVATPVASSSIIPTTANTASYVAGANVDGTVASATSASFATNSNTATSASHAVQADSALTATSATTATSASHAVNADTATSSSHAVSADSSISSSYVTNQENFAKINENNVFTGTQTFDNIAVNGTGSFGYLESITGSAKVIGDAFLVLNNDTPTQRYAGIKVIDSGSTNTTGSLIWDGDSNEWKYEYSASAGHESAVVLMGPEMEDIGTSVYPTANEIQKGTGGHHLTGSNITDDGSLVKINSNSQITGSLNITGSARNASKIYGNLTQQLGSPGNNNQYDLITIPSTTVDGQTYTNVNNFFADYSSFGQNYKDYFAYEYYDSFGYNYGSEFAVNGIAVNMSQGLENTQSGVIRIIKKAPSLIANGRGTVSGSSTELRARGTGSQVDILAYNGAAVNISSTGQQGGSTAYMTLASDSNITYTATNNNIFSGSIDSKDGITAPSFTGSLSGTATTASYVNPLDQDVQITGSLNITGSSRNASKIIGNLYQSFPSPGNNNTVSLMELSGTNTIGSNNYTNKNFFVADFNSFGDQFKDYFSIEYYDSFSYNYGTELNVNGIVGRIATVASGSGTAGSRTSIIETRDNQDGTSQVRLNTGDQAKMLLQAGNQGIEVSGSVKSQITALSIASNTASLDVQDGDMFTLSLVSGSDTHLSASNIQAGQTINVKVLQPSTAADSYGTLSFAPEFKFAGGTAPTITAASGSTDILTFQSYDASSLFGTAVQNLS